MWYRGLMLVCSIVFVASANAQQQQDTTKHGWGIVYSSPKSRATASPATSTAPAAVTPPAQGITPTPPPAAPSQSQVTTLPTIRGTSANTAPAPTPPANGTYMGDRPPAAAPSVAAAGTYDTVPPGAVNATSGSGVHLDELMSLHEYSSTGLTNLKPQEVQALEIWLERYRTALIDSVTRATQQRAATSQVAPMAPTPAPTAVASPRPVAPANAHTVTGIRSGSRFVQIDDGSVWDIYPADQSETAAWQVGDNVTVRVAAQAYGEFDHELVNGQRTGPVRAKFMGYARGQ
ncbi:MAG TPA: hypothetical protein VFA43_20825 [Gemmatimonadaceae bacterium]|nr:hypothetical protein [Gemmatimonadaceae bacterium]